MWSEWYLGVASGHRSDQRANPVAEPSPPVCACVTGQAELTLSRCPAPKQPQKKIPVRGRKRFRSKGDTFCWRQCGQGRCLQALPLLHSWWANRMGRKFWNPHSEVSEAGHADDRHNGGGAIGEELSNTPSSFSLCSQRAHTTTRFCIERIRSGGLTHRARREGPKPKLPDSPVHGFSCHSHSMTGSWGGRVGSRQLPDLGLSIHCPLYMEQPHVWVMCVCMFLYV